MTDYEKFEQFLEDTEGAKKYMLAAMTILKAAGIPPLPAAMACIANVDADKLEDVITLARAANAWASEVVRQGNAKRS